MPSLLDITNEIQHVENLLSDAEVLGLESTEYEEKLNALFRELSSKTDRMDRFLDSIDIKIREVEAIHKAYEEKAKEYKTKYNSIVNTKKRILELFLKTGLVDKEKQFKTQFRTYFVKITKLLERDEDAICPDEFKIIEYKEKVNELKKYIEEGNDIAGYRLIENKNVMRR
jgi:hypothetical protein